MMEEQENLGNILIGTKEPEKMRLEPKKVKIVGWKVKEIEKAHNSKVEFEVKHPDRDDTIFISSVSYLDGRSVTTSGTWINKDADGNLQKGTALTILMQKIGAKSLNDAKEKESDTEQDDKGYLCFKAY